ncbi:MAG TPA: hypothetical protein VGF86_08985 [Candidatus Tumulicola sp.]
MSVIIIEGVTGAGKTSTIAALRGIAAFEYFDEDATFDDFMSEFLRDPDPAERKAHARMAAILDEVETECRSQHFLLERFYFSQIAIGSNSERYRDLEARCAALKCKVVALTLPDEELAPRCLYRAEYDGRDWQNFIPYYGSEERAVASIRLAQRRRIDAIERCSLEYRLIDTSEKAWERYAAEIADYAGYSLSTGS